MQAAKLNRRRRRRRRRRRLSFKVGLASNYQFRLLSAFFIVGVPIHHYFKVEWNSIILHHYFLLQIDGDYENTFSSLLFIDFT